MEEWTRGSSSPKDMALLNQGTTSFKGYNFYFQSLPNIAVILQIN